jgi:hypothetical protein
MFDKCTVFKVILLPAKQLSQKLTEIKWIPIVNVFKRHNILKWITIVKR